MVSGGNADNVEYRLDVYKRRLEDWQCLFCKPHRMENRRRWARHGMQKNRATK